MADKKGSKTRKGGILSTILVLALLGAQRMGWLPVGNDDASEGGVATQEAPSTPSPTTKEPKAAEPEQAPSKKKEDDGRSTVVKLHADRRSEVMVTVTAKIVHVLPDDNEGSRHQRFLLEIEKDLTVKVAHNIDLAPRVPISKGDVVKIRGQYEWNDLGGVLHWTHHDPGKYREGGWIEFDGKRYE